METVQKKNEVDTRLFGWRRTGLLITLLLVSIFSQIDRVLPFILAESIKIDLNLSDTQLGLLTGLAFSICYSLASLPLARIADKGRAKEVLVVCLVLWSAMTTLGGFAYGFALLSISRFGVALGEAGGTPASHTLIVNSIPKKLQGRAIGLYTMGLPLGTMIGFALGGWIGEQFGWRYAFIGAGTFGAFLVIMIMVFVMKNSVVKHHPFHEDNFMTSVIKLFSKPAFVRLFIVSNLFG